MFRQCRLRSENAHLVAWLPAKKLKEGILVELKGEPGRWWEVLSIGDTELTEDQAKAMKQRIHRGVFGSIKHD